MVLFGLEKHVVLYGLRELLLWQQKDLVHVHPEQVSNLAASERLASYLPVSMALMVWRVTPTLVASSSWDHSFPARSNLPLALIGDAKQSIETPDRKSADG